MNGDKIPALKDGGLILYGFGLGYSKKASCYFLYFFLGGPNLL